MRLLILFLLPLVSFGQIDSLRYGHSEIYYRTVEAFNQETIWMQSTCTYQPEVKYRCQILSSADKVTISLIEINPFLTIAIGYDPHYEFGHTDSVEAVVLQLHENTLTELDFGYVNKNRNLIKLPGGTAINLSGNYHIASFTIGGDNSLNKFIMPRYEFDY